MVDKAIGFLLNSNNDPVPENVLLEDRLTPVSGMQSSPHSAVEIRSTYTSSTSSHNAILAEMQKTSKVFCDALLNSGTNKHISELCTDTMNAISHAEGMKEKVYADATLSEAVKKRRIDIYNRSVSNLYDKLDSINSI